MTTPRFPIEMIPRTGRVVRAETIGHVLVEEVAHTCIAGTPQGDVEREDVSFRVTWGAPNDDGEHEGHHAADWNIAAAMAQDLTSGAAS